MTLLYAVLAYAPLDAAEQAGVLKNATAIKRARRELLGHGVTPDDIAAIVHGEDSARLIDARAGNAQRKEQPRASSWGAERAYAGHAVVEGRSWRSGRPSHKQRRTGLPGGVARRSAVAGLAVAILSFDDPTYPHPQLVGIHRLGQVVIGTKASRRVSDG